MVAKARGPACNWQDVVLNFHPFEFVLLSQSLAPLNNSLTMTI